MDLSYWQNISAEELYLEIASDENCRFVLKTMRDLTSDGIWTETIINAVESKQIETRCFISWLANKLKPKNYLEVGVRRGFSMAMVAAGSPETEIYGFDMWIKNYADTPNPGPQFVESEIRRTGFDKKIHFYAGDSHQTLTFFFGNNLGFKDRIKAIWLNRNNPTEFELITVDGDHTLLGAYQDLSDVMPHCAVGGVVVFDDIKPDALKRDAGEPDPHEWRSLLGVWHAIQRVFPNFRYFEFLDHQPGVGLAVRLK